MKKGAKLLHVAKVGLLLKFDSVVVLEMSHAIRLPLIISVEAFCLQQGFPG